MLIGGISLYRTFAMYKIERSFDVLKGTVPDFSSGDVTLAFTVNGESTDNIPTKEGNYAIQVDCDKGNGIWNREKWGIEVSNIEEAKVKCNIEFTTLTENKSIFNFDYKGKEEAISLPSGKYKLEVWGGQGGVTLTGGYGAYSKGEIKLTANATLYINVGGQGNVNIGGYNGGGDGLTNTIQGSLSGGGATHIATISGLLSSLEAHKDDNTILIVAGGGGGGNISGALGGSGGGFQGKNGVNSMGVGANYLGTGATQSEGGHDTTFVSAEESKGKFGLGGKAYAEMACNGICGGFGGGGGYYGGGGSSRGHAGAGGGSGYIGNTQLMNKGMWCYQCDASEEDNTKTTSTDQVSEEPTSMYAKQGNGYARITYLGNN